ncbi:hypothetical protein SASPL_157285 [Salvia splendens]|uniref:Phospholipase/carboxylesterase/thioesterase domain-containing protein n=1 Tax=Salvia splendens TaxID=180675 RepID=A0A8X8VV46_SALSN|nr:hypothetical protein SASPL_157285 [Salvia splendens]
MKLTLAKSFALFTLTFGITLSFVLLNHQSPLPTKPDPMARTFILWLHGLGDSGPANEPIKNLFTSPVFANTKWSFPSAPNNPVTCNYGSVMPSWFDIHELPMTADSPQDEAGVLKAVQNVHAMIDTEIAAGTNPNNIFICGFSQGGALTLASVLLYPKTLGGGAVFSGWVPFNSSILQRVAEDAKKPLELGETSKTVGEDAAELEARQAELDDSAGGASIATPIAGGGGSGGVPSAQCAAWIVQILLEGE